MRILSRSAYTIWCFFLLFLSQTTTSVVQGELQEIEPENLVFDVPSFSFLLRVSKADKALITFQDRLQNSIHDHLVNFFRGKVEIPDFGRANVEEVALKSNLVWKLLSSPTTNKKQNANGDIMTEYEVTSDFDCELTINVEETSTGETGAKMRLSPNIMDLFLIEAFQGDNYWHLVHNFLSDETLEGITDVKITVFSDAYVATNGHQALPQSNKDIAYAEDNNGLSAAMTVGVVFSFFFFVVLILMWAYICLFAKRTSIFKGRINPFGKVWDDDLSKATVMDSSEQGSIDLDYVDQETRWMDAWAHSITSISLRAPVKTKKRMRKAARNPAKSHISSLGRITEVSSEDECSLASTASRDEEKQQRRQKQTPSDSAGEDGVGLASIDEEVKEMGEATSTSPSVKLDDGNSRALVVAKTRTLSQWIPSLDFRISTSEATETPLPLENLNEMC